MPKLICNVGGRGFSPRPFLCASSALAVGALAVGALAVGVGVRESCGVVVATLSEEEEEVRLCR
ncbi:MAG TPA: hypothetical protein VI027_03925 [Rubrobacteraceae bacterium]